MKKITLFLSVLLMAIVVKAQTEATATLVHTASSFCTDDPTVFTSTVDSEKEVVNNSSFAAKWAGAAYAEFTMTLPDGDYTITNASLSWTGIGESRNTRNTDVYYANTGETLDYETMQAGTAKVNLEATKITSVTFPKGDGATTDFVTDVTGAVKAIVEAGQKYIIFKFTGNPGGGHLVGKGAAEKVPVLTIETADASAMTTYTVKYVDEEGNEIAEAAVRDIAKGETASISDGDKAVKWNADNTKKYIYKSCDKESITAVADGASNVITATFREAEIFQYTVNSVDADENILKIYKGYNFEGENVKIPYNTYILNEGLLYEASKTNKEYNKYVNLTQNNMTVQVTYSKTSIENVVYYQEAEDIDGLTKVTTGNTTIRSSNSASAYAAETDVVLTNLAPGKYKITAVIYDATKSLGSEFDFVADANTVLKAISTTANWTNCTSEEFILTANTDLSLVKGGSSSKAVDFVYIQKTGEVLTVVDEEDLTAEAGATYAAATYTRTVNPDYNYGTICLPFAPDAETCENYTFYELGQSTANTVTFVEVETPQANVPYLYSAVDGEATTHTFTGGETTVSLALTPASAGTWAISGSFTEEVHSSIAGIEFYAYKPTAESDVLVKAKNSVTVKPYRAYFMMMADNGGIAPLTTVRIVVRGAGDNGDGTTGIEEVITPDQIEGAAPAIYNLMGQPVAQPVKGQIYIVNGKKVVY